MGLAVGYYVEARQRLGRTGRVCVCLLIIVCWEVRGRSVAVCIDELVWWTACSMDGLMLGFEDEIGKKRFETCEALGQGKEVRGRSEMRICNFLAYGQS